MKVCEIEVTRKSSYYRGSRCRVNFQSEFAGFLRAYCLLYAAASRQRPRNQHAAAD